MRPRSRGLHRDLCGAPRPLRDIFEYLDPRPFNDYRHLRRPVIGAHGVATEDSRNPGLAVRRPYRAGVSLLSVQPREEGYVRT
jgi:hypothetical protein